MNIWNWWLFAVAFSGLMLDLGKEREPHSAQVRLSELQLLFGDLGKRVSFAPRGPLVLSPHLRTFRSGPGRVAQLSPAHASYMPTPGSRPPAGASHACWLLDHSDFRGPRHSHGHFKLLHPLPFHLFRLAEKLESLLALKVSEVEAVRPLWERERERMELDAEAGENQGQFGPGGAIAPP